jgi:spoIIIJ-associated protein
MRGTTVAAQRGGRRRATPQDVVRDALVAALADALDVDPERLAVSLRLDDELVPADRLPMDLELRVPEAPTPPVTAHVADDVAEPDEDGEDDDTEDAPAASSARGRGGEGRQGRASAREDEPRDRSPRVASEPPAVSAEDLDEEAEAAADLLEGLLDALDLPGDLRISIQDAHAEVEVVGLEEGVLIGRRGQTLDAVQELVRTAMQRRFERRSRVLVDVDGYRARRLEKLLERADEAIEEVLASGEPQRLEPMDAIERRLVHQRVTETAGVMSTSHGREPARRIVIELADD